MNDGGGNATTGGLQFKAFLFFKDCGAVATTTMTAGAMRRFMNCCRCGCGGCCGDITLCCCISRMVVSRWRGRIGIAVYRVNIVNVMTIDVQIFQDQIVGVIAAVVVVIATVTRRIDVVGLIWGERKS